MTKKNADEPPPPPAPKPTFACPFCSADAWLIERQPAYWPRLEAVVGRQRLPLAV